MTTAERRQTMPRIDDRLASQGFGPDTIATSPEAVALRFSQPIPAESKWLDIDGPVHYVDYGGPIGAATMVLVHGLMGSHLNWLALVPELTDQFRVLALDLVGHGRTPRAGRSSGVRSNQHLLHRFLDEAVDGPAVLVGSSMGGLITILQAADNPETVAGLVLVGPALPAIPTKVPSPTLMLNYLPLALPALGPALLSARQRRTDAESAVQSLLMMTTARPEHVSREVIREHVKLADVRLRDAGASASYPAAAQSTLLALLQVRDATLRSIQAPVLLIQGEEDKVISPGGARKFAAKNPHWDYESYAGIGHAPMLESPEKLAASMKTWAQNRLI